jgi:hypothetical protein
MRTGSLKEWRKAWEIDQGSTDTLNMAMSLVEVIRLLSDVRIPQKRFLTRPSLMQCRIPGA